jgi:Arc/MetJ family transcription regulator
MHKRTNIELDVDLVKKAMELTHLHTIKDVVHHALTEVIRMNKRKDLLKFKGKVNWNGNLDEMRSI